MKAFSPRHSGFTLLEILVAIAIFAIFSAMAYGGLMRLLDNRERIDAERTFWRETTLAFLRIEQDLALARNRPIRSVSGDVQPAFRGQPTDIRALAEPSIEFTRGGILVPHGQSADLQRVGYLLSEDKLMRQTWPVLDHAPATQPRRAPLLHNVEEFEARFYQAGTWIDRWPPIQQGNAQAPKLPAAVQITVVFKDRGRYTRTFLVGADK